jgi:chromosome segregation ATPase
MKAYNRLERKIDKLERSIEKKKEQIHNLEHQLKDQKISEQKFCSKKKHLQIKIRDLDAEVRILKGGLVRKKHQLGKTAE